MLSEAETIVAAVDELIAEHREFLTSEVGMMHWCPDITGSSVSKDVGGYRVTISIERDEDEL